MAAALLAAMLAVPLGAAPASAADSKGAFAVEGIGVLPCSDYVEARAAASDKYSRYVGWAEGYLTASNAFEPQTYDLTPWENSELVAFIIDNHCKQNPDDRFFSVVQRTAVLLRKGRLEAESPRVEAKAGDETLPLYQEVIRRVQAALAERKLYEGEADGLYGPKTRQAVETFQALEGLNITGLPDQPTLSRLFAGRHAVIR